MSKLNMISENGLFCATSLKEGFEKSPIGFIDIGSSGGVHPMILPIASIANCLCFEPNEKALKSLNKIESMKFSKLKVYNTAIREKESETDFYITESEVNSSLLTPSKEMVTRYSAPGFKIKNRTTLKTKALDNVISEIGRSEQFSGEIIKLDCQGSEYEILKGASEILEKQCVALFCEVEFFEVYKNQKIFSDIDQFLRKKGFSLYGLYPNYISTKKIDRKKYETEERIMWADAVYFKDPLTAVNFKNNTTDRSIHVLILVSMMLNYYDFSIELIRKYIENERDKLNLVELVEYFASCRKDRIEQNAKKLISRFSKPEDDMFLYVKKFIDENKGNNNLDYINVDEFPGGTT
jgi:FkbM family methyltransferase